MTSPVSGVSRDANESPAGPATPEPPRARGLESLADFCRDPSLEPDTPPLPGVVVFYGTILTIMGTFGAIATVAGTLILLVRPARPSGSLDLTPLLEGGIRLAISLIYLRLGRGMRSGERLSVLAFCALSGVALLCVLLFLWLTDLSMEVRLLVLLVAGLLYIPPVVSAFRHWRAFH
jgi:hypothetical protein